VRTLSPEEAAGQLRTTDTLGLPLGPGQPAAYLEALGARTDWTDLRIYGALLTVLSDVFAHPNVHYLSGFFGPLERMLRDTGANLSFAPADFRRFVPILEAQAPRVMVTAAAPPDADGWCSLSLHAGASVDELHRAGADPDRVLLVEVSPAFPRTRGHGEHRHAVHVDEIDLLVESDRAPFVLEDPPPTDVERAIAEQVRTFIPDGATIQTGIGAVPSMVAALLAEGPGGGYGIHSEMFTTGLMRLHEAGKVTNDKGQYDGVSVVTFAAGTAELYEWLDGNDEVVFLPVGIVNSPECMACNPRTVNINAALAVDIHGQAVADTIGGAQYSGIGGAEDFAAGAGLQLEDRSLLCLPSTYTRGGETFSRIVPWFDAGTVVTLPRHQVDAVITEYGTAQLQGLTVHQRGLALAAIAHPDFRDELAEAAERTTGGRSALPPAL
jgi:acyl-CoA hydrolase